MDVEDVIRNLKTFPAPKPTAEQIYADVVLSYTFLFEACGRCRNHGRHNFAPVSDVKILAEGFIGRPINDVAFQIGIRMNGLRTKASNKVMIVKLPPLNKFEESRELWNQHQKKEEREIDEELKRWAGFLAKHPSYRP
jgi:hypothetical protein